MTSAGFTEADIAAGADKWLRENGYTVYREVADGYGGHRADLVGKRGALVHVVECKARLSLDLIDQAVHWIGRAQLVSVAVPRKGRSRAVRKYPSQVLRCLGVGRLSIDSPGTEYANAVQGIYPRWHGIDRRRVPVSALLLDEQRTMGEAGTSKGGYATAWKLTMRDVAAFVAKNPGCTIKEAVAGVSHHYSHDKSARQGVVFAVKSGLLGGVRVDRDSRPWRLRPEA